MINIIQLKEGNILNRFLSNHIPFKRLKIRKMPPRITLPSLLCPKKYFGVGEKATRSIWDKFPEKSFWIITKIRPHEDLRHGKVYGKLTFRGKEEANEKRIRGVLKNDWRLLPKDEII